MDGLAVVEAEQLDPYLLVDSAVAAAKSGMPDDGAAWTVDVESDVPPYVGDRIKLRQAVRNLVANAMDIQPDGGRVAVRQFLDGDTVVIRVTDAGPGIPEHLRGRLLDPFFTTRAEGTGLGLALVSTIAQLHGGSLEIGSDKSELGGAEFSLRIPLSPVK